MRKRCIGVIIHPGPQFKERFGGLAARLIANCRGNFSPRHPSECRRREKILLPRQNLLTTNAEALFRLASNLYLTVTNTIRKQIRCLLLGHYRSESELVLHDVSQRHAPLNPQAEATVEIWSNPAPAYGGPYYKSVKTVLQIT